MQGGVMTELTILRSGDWPRVTGEPEEEEAVLLNGVLQSSLRAEGGGIQARPAPRVSAFCELSQRVFMIGWSAQTPTGRTGSAKSPHSEAGAQRGAPVCVCWWGCGWLCGRRRHCSKIAPQPSGGEDDGSVRSRVGWRLRLPRKPWMQEPPATHLLAMETAKGRQQG